MRVLWLLALCLAACTEPFLRDIPLPKEAASRPCGNSVLDTGEDCDDGNGTSGDGCSAACAQETGWTCTGLPSACTEICGDGLVVGNEGCDDRDTLSNGEGSCLADCSKTQLCGDGDQDGTEVCDEGLSNGAGDGFCLSSCLGVQLCGDGTTNGSEQCDDTNDVDTDDCTNVCETARCGDSLVRTTTTPEACDDGAQNGTGNAHCLLDCSGVQSCGDGTTNGTELCDHGAANGTGDGFCLSDCSGIEGCGNGTTEGTETCDDGANNGTGDGFCLTNCSGTQTCGNGTREGTEACDDDDQLDNGEGSCTANCLAVQICRDGTRQGTEACDDGNANNGDYCTSDCSAVTGMCGDGIKQSNEICDDNDSQDNGEGFCTANCLAIQVCGNSSQEGTETCDDGNLNSNDGCSSTCQIESGSFCKGPACTRILFVNGAATGNNDGFSWPNAHTSLQEALTHAHQGSAKTELWVAQGTYSPGTQATDTFALDIELVVYGGFAGNEFLLNQRNFGKHITRLSGGNVARVLNITANTRLDGVTIEGGNTAGNGGGALINAANVWLVNTTFVNNTAGRGAAIYMRDSTFEFWNTRFIANQATAQSGAIDMLDSAGRMGGCLFNGNRAPIAATIWTESYGSTVRIYQSTFYNNRHTGAEPFGRDILNEGFNDILVYNSLVDVGSLSGVAVDTGSTLAGGEMSFIDADGADNVPSTEDDDLRPTASSSAVGSAGLTNLPSDFGDLNYNGNTQEKLPIDLAGHPRIVDLLDVGAFEHYLPTCGDGSRTVSEACDDGNTLDGDYCSANCLVITGFCGDSLTQANEACDDGLATPTCEAHCLPPDCGDGVTNFSAGETCDDGNEDDGDGCDANCLAEPGAVCAGSPWTCRLRVYVDQNAAPGGNGQSWGSALNKLQDALAFFTNAAAQGDIWVATGTYHPDEGGSVIDNDRSSVFTISGGVHLYGGFVGTENELHERMRSTPRSVLSADLGGGIYSYRVIVVGAVNDIVIDGFVIQDALLNGLPLPMSYGGGLSITGLADARAHVSLKNVTFKNNQAGAGAGIAVGFGDVRLSHVDFLGNSAELGCCGGAVLARDSNVFVEGGVYVGNRSTIGGGAFYLIDSALRVNNATFVHNVAQFEGSVVYAQGSTPTFNNSVFWQNSSSLFVGSRMLQGSCGDTQGEDGSTQDPRFVRLPNAGAADWGSLRLRYESPCIDQGLNHLVPSTLVEDALGHARIFDHPQVANGSGSVDPGAYETVSCGDAYVDAFASEACDDGNNEDGDYCASDCSEVLGACGDGTVQANLEQCDDSGESPTCNANCTNQECGDGIINATALEECDDYNAGDGDGCTGGCFIEPEFSCSGEPSYCRYIVYVNASATGANDGSSWTDAFVSLHDALGFNSGFANEVWVAAGTYVVDPSSTSAGTSFFVLGGTAIYGGFAGLETARHQRDWQTNITVLDGQNFTRHILAVLHDPNPTTLDGLHITGSAGGGGNGTALFADSEVRLQNLSIYNNAGGTALDLAETSSRIVNMTAWQNSGVLSVFNVGTPVTVAPLQIINSTFASNTDVFEVSNLSGAPPFAMHNSIVWNNTGSFVVGAITAPVVSYSLVQDGFVGTGNLAANPLFVGPQDFHLSAGSPAIDAGNNAALLLDEDDQDGDGNTQELWPFDASHAARQVDAVENDTGAGIAPIVDMGAYER